MSGACQLRHRNRPALVDSEPTGRYDLAFRCSAVLLPVKHKLNRVVPCRAVRCGVVIVVLLCIHCGAGQSMDDEGTVKSECG